MVLGVKKIQTHSNSRGCALLALLKKKKKKKKCALLKKYVNQSFTHNSKTKRDIAKISAVVKPMKSDYFVVKFWQKSE